MTVSLYTQSEEFPTYADYRRAKAREYKKKYKERNKEKCRAVDNARRRLRYAQEPGYAESILAAAKEKYKNDPTPFKKRAAAKRTELSGTPEYIEAQRSYRLQNKAEIAASKQVWVKKNLHKVLSRGAARRALCKQATPAWADKQEIQNVYLEARHMQMHVDHIVPLNHPLVCGLHVWENLQVLTPFANMQKNNHFDPETYDAC